MPAALMHLRAVARARKSREKRDHGDEGGGVDSGKDREDVGGCNGPGPPKGGAAEGSVEVMAGVHAWAELNEKQVD